MHVVVVLSYSAALFDAYEKETAAVAAAATGGGGGEAIKKYSRRETFR
jgi:hypothetical protein